MNYEFLLAGPAGIIPCSSSPLRLSVSLPGLCLIKALNRLREIKLRNRGSSSASLASRREIASFPYDLMERLKVELLGRDEVVLLGGDEVALLGGDEVALLGGDEVVLLGGDEVVLLGGDEVVLLGGDRKSEILAWQERVGKDRTYFSCPFSLFLPARPTITVTPTPTRPQNMVFFFVDNSAGETGAGWLTTVDVAGV
jgi:hypothetical protein